MTLIEIIIVVALIGLLMATLVFGSGIFTGANRRAASTLLVTSIRRGLAHANTTGKPARLLMNMETGRLILQESGSSEALVGGEETEEEELKQPLDAGAALLADAESAAEVLLSGQTPVGDGFSSTDVLGNDGDKPGRELGSGVRFVKVHTENDEEPTEDGEAYLYFWPGGVTERAVIQITSSGSESGMTVVVSPLTGRAEIKRGFVELPERLFDEEYSEREER